MSKEWTVAEIEQEVQKLDPNLSREDTSYMVAVAMLSAVIVGPNLNKVAKFTGYSREFLRPFFNRLRENKVFQRGKIAADWFDDDAGGVAFWMDVCVAQGLMART